MLNNPLKYTDPSGYTYRAQAVTFKGRENPDGSYGNFAGFDGGGGSVFQKMGVLNGEAGPVFEDLYFEGPTGNWVRRSGLQKDVVARYVSKDAYVSVGSQRYYKGSSLHLSREPIVATLQVRNISTNIDSWYERTKGQPLMDFEIKSYKGIGGKGKVELFGQKIALGIHIITQESSYNVVKGYKKTKYSGLELGLGPLELSGLYVYDQGYDFKFGLSSLKFSTTSDPKFNIFNVTGYLGAGGSVGLDMDIGKYIQSFDPTLDYRYLLYK